ncbi:hypothetical protein K1719_012288 [Acacia pycnantha]|nr:hypothetical protein K1719_012288 [Acacia pycnantha]
MMRLLFDGPWLIQGHYLAVQIWSPNFNPYYNKVQKEAVLVRIPMLSMQVYAENCLLEVGNMIGKALKVDINTLAECHNRNMMVERGKFARVSVEVDLNQAPKSRGESAREIYARGNSRNVSENHMCCHAQIKPLVSVLGVNSEDKFSSWMIAKNNFRKRSHKLEAERRSRKLYKDNKTNGKGKKSASSTRFDVLQEVEDHIFSKCVDLHRKMEVAMTVWRRKEVEALLSNKEGVVGDKERENLNLDKGEKGIMLLGESHIKSSTDREKKEKGKIVKEKEGKDLKVMARNASHNKELNGQCYVAQHVKSNDVDDGEEDLEIVSSFLAKGFHLSKYGSDHRLQPMKCSPNDNHRSLAP